MLSCKRDEQKGGVPPPRIDLGEGEMTHQEGGAAPAGTGTTPVTQAPANSDEVQGLTHSSAKSHNCRVVASELCEIVLTRGFVALVDEDDCEWLSQDKWWADKLGHAITWVPGPTSRGSKLQMHRMVVESRGHDLSGESTFSERIVVHHLNGRPWDNRFENLAVMTNAEHTALHTALRSRQAGSVILDCLAFAMFTLCVAALLLLACGAMWIVWPS